MGVAVIMERRSFECGGESVGGFTQIPDGSQPVTDGQTLPVAIALPFLLAGIGAVLSAIPYFLRL